MSDLSSDRDPFELIAESFLARYRAGERPSIEEYAALHPELADQIRELLPALVMVEQDLAIDSGADPNVAVRMVPDAPRRLGDYRVLREIGRGGMGVVYEAEQISLGRRVALKILLGQVVADHKSLERFRREAKSAARLHHTNIVPIFEVGRERDISFYAMQLIQGQGLDQVIYKLRRLREPDRRANGQSPLRPTIPEAEGTVTQASVAPSSGLRRPDLGWMADLLLSGRLVTEGPGAPVIDSPAVTGLLATERFDPEASSPRESARTRADLSLAPPTPGSSSSAVLPGGRMVSEIDTSGRRQPFFKSVAQIGRQAAQGLAHAHARGIVHRDIKPSNLLLDTDGVVWITDFGLAKADDDGLTATGDILGTLRYMAPERFRGEGDARADIYALGLTIYELLALRPAYGSSDRLKLIEQVKSEEPARPRSIDNRIPRDLETIVFKAIDKEPGRRYATADAMAEDLRRFLADEPILARRASAAERYWRWARRNPLIAGLGGVLTGVLLIATIGSLMAAQQFHNQAGTQQALAEDEARAHRKADEANASLQATQEELRRTVYATRSNLALAGWDAADVGRLRSLLDLLRPDSGDTDLRGWEWRYLWQLGHEDRLTLRASADNFVAVAFSPDGKTLAGLEAKGRIQLWDRQTGELRLMTGVVTTAGRRADLSGGVSALAFSPDGHDIAGPGPDASLMLYSVDSGLPTLTFQGPPGAVLSLAWSPDGRTLVAGIAAHVILGWNARDGHRVQNGFGGHEGPVASVAFSPDGLTLASASYDHKVKLWDIGNPVHPRAILQGHTDEVRAVAFNPDGRRVASAGLDRTVRVWDAGSGAEVAVIRGHTGAVSSLAYLPKNEQVVTGSADETVRVWDTTSGQELRTFKGHTADVSAVAVSPDGRDLASTSGDRTARVWDAASPPRPRTLQSPSVLRYGGGVECVAFAPDGRWLVSGHDDNALRVWELPSGRTLHVIKGHTKRILYVAFSPDGRTIASGSNDGTVRLWDAATGGPRITFTGHTDAIQGLVFTPDGQTILSGSLDRTIQAWDPATGVVRYTLRGHSEKVNDLALSPDGLAVASVSSDKTCILWDLLDRKPRMTLRGHTDTINSVAFSPDGRMIATSSDDHTVRLWDAATGSSRGILIGHLDSIEGLAFSPDGRLASSSRDKTIRLWDPASGQTLLILKGHAGLIRSLNFSRDGRTLASAGHDRTIMLWDAAPADVLAADRDKALPDSNTEAADSRRRIAREEQRPILYATSSNLALAASDANDILRLRFLLDLMKPRQDESDLRGWEWHYLNRLAQEDRATFRGPDREVKKAAFSPDGRTFASVHQGGRVSLWDLATGHIRLTLQTPQPATWDQLQAGVSGVTFSPDGGRLAGPGPNGNLGIWNTQSGALLNQFKVSALGTPSVAFSPDGRTILTGSTSRKLRIWDALGGKPDVNGYGPLVRLFENAHDGTVERAVFSPDGRRVASTGAGTIKIWDVEASKLHATLPSTGVQVFALDFSADGGTLVSGGSDHLVHVWDAGTGSERRQLSGHASTVTALAFRPDDHLLLSAGSDAVVRLWDIESGRQLNTFEGHTGPIDWDGFSPDGKTLASNTFDKMLKIWDRGHPLQPQVLKSPFLTENAVSSYCVASSPDGRRIAAGYTDNAIRVWDSATGFVQWTLTGHDQPVSGVAFSPDGQTLASCSQDKTVRIWDLATGQLRSRLANDQERVNSMAFSPDGRRLVSCGDDGTLKVCVLETGECLRTFQDQTKSALIARYSPDGRSIASAGLDGRIRLWNAETGQLMATIGGHPEKVQDLAFSPDGRTIASGSVDRTVMLWDCASGQHRLTFQGHTAGVDSVAFSPDGRRLVSSGQDQTIRLWDLASGQELLTLRGHSGRIRSIAFSGDGRKIVSASDDGRILIWDASPLAPLPGNLKEKPGD